MAVLEASAHEFDIEAASEVGPVREIAFRISGRRPAHSTAIRWIREGVCGVRLAAIYLRGRWQTSPEAFVAFVNAQTAAMLGEVSR